MWFWRGSLRSFIASLIKILKGSKVNLIKRVFFRLKLGIVKGSRKTELKCLGKIAALHRTESVCTVVLMLFPTGVYLLYLLLLLWLNVAAFLPPKALIFSPHLTLFFFLVSYNGSGIKIKKFYIAALSKNILIKCYLLQYIILLLNKFYGNSRKIHRFTRRKRLSKTRETYYKNFVWPSL